MDAATKPGTGCKFLDDLDRPKIVRFSYPRMRSDFVLPEGVEVGGD